MQKFISDSPPHIRAQSSVPKIYWMQSLSLLPIVITSFIAAPWEAFKLIGVSIPVSVATFYFAKQVLKSQTRLVDGLIILMALLLALTLPVSLPVWGIALASFMMVFFGIEFFGGTGQYAFHPVLVGHGFLVAMYPDLYQPARILSLGTWQEFFLYKDPYFLMESGFCALLFGGVFLLVRGSLKLITPLLFLGVLALMRFLLDFGGLETFAAPVFIFVSFYFVTDFTTTPLSKAGVNYFVIFAALLSALWEIYVGLYSYVFAILILNALTPWMDITLRPKGMLSQ